MSLSKGCYLGQETLARLATYDGVKQQLRRWHLPAGEGNAPEPGAGLVQGEGARAGQVTTVLALPEGGWMGLALVRRAALAEPRLATAAGAWLTLSQPDGVQEPPVGPGGRQGGEAGSSGAAA